MGIGQITRSFSSSFSSFDHPSRRSSPPFSGSPVRGVCEAGFSRAEPRQSETKSNRIQRLPVQLTRPSRAKQANNSFNCYSVAQSTIKRLTCPRVPGSWPHCRWESPKRWTFRGLACPPSPALGFDQAYTAGVRASTAEASAKPSSNAHQAFKLATSATVAQSCFTNDPRSLRTLQLWAESLQRSPVATPIEPWV
jgi:hypothetical protein